MNDDVIAIVIDCTKSVFHGLSASKSAVCEYYAGVFYSRVVKRIEKFVTERGVYRNDDFAHSVRCQKGFDCFDKHARIVARSKQFVVHSIALARAACGDNDIDFHNSPCD